MSTYNSIEKIISEEIMRTNEDNLIARKICASVCSGEIKKRGDSVVITGLSEPTVYDYTGSISYEDVNDASMILNIDQDKAFSFKIKDIEELRSSIGLRDSQARRASYNLKLEVDKYVLGLYKEAGYTYTNTEVTPANVLKVLAEIKQKLEEANVPDGRTFIVIPPFVKTKLMLAGIKFQINNGVNGTGTIGFTDELGYDVYVSNQLAKSTSEGKTLQQALAGSYSSIAYAEQVLETQILDKLENSFDKAVRGRLVFGAKVIKPNELVAAGLIDGANEL